MKVLQQNLAIARDFSPMSVRARAAHERDVRDVAGDGRFELYKTTAEHEGPIGRKQHGFPPQERVPM